MSILSQFIKKISSYFKKQLKKSSSLSNSENKIHHSFIMGKYSEINLEADTSSVFIDENFYTRNYCQIRIGANARLSIGKNVFLNNYSSITCMKEINIGNNVMLGEGVRIYDHNHLIERGEQLVVSRNKLNYGGINIGENCWIGSNVVILKGVTVGANSVIGAGCLIHVDIPANSIVTSKLELNIVSS